MSHPGNDHLIDLARDNDLDEEAITIHSTDDDLSFSEKLDEIESRIDPEVRALVGLTNEELKALLSFKE